MADFHSFFAGIRKKLVREAEETTALSPAMRAPQGKQPLFSRHRPKQPFALADQFVQAPFAGEIFRIGFEVIGNIADAFSNQSNLHGGGAGVVGAALKFADDVFSVLYGKYHFILHLG